MSGRFSLAERLASFRHAAAGIVTLLREQHNTRIHLFATVVVAALAAYLDVTRAEWIALLVAIGLVWMTEAFNSAVEYLSDAAVPEQHPLIRKAKDVAASGVLLAAFVAALIGALVFLPRLT